MQVRIKVFSIVCLALLLGAAQLSEAQQRGRGRGFSASVLSVAAVPEVAKELQFSDEQTATAKKLNDELNELRSTSFQGLADLSDDQRRARFDEYTEKSDAKEKQLAEAIGAEKFQRLQQLNWQAAGVAAAFTGDAAEKLGVTDDQQQQASDARRDLFGQLRDAGDDAEARAKVMASINEKLASILNDDQKKAWKELIGEPADEELLGKIREATRFRGGRRNT